MTRKTHLTLEDVGVDIDTLMDRMKARIGVEQDSELADYLHAARSGIKYRPQALHQWRVRQSIPLAALVLFARLTGQGLDVLLFEDGTPEPFGRAENQ